MRGMADERLDNSSASSRLNPPNSRIICQRLIGRGVGCSTMISSMSSVEIIKAISPVF
jgi:hypothetical protein